MTNQTLSTPGHTKKNSIKFRSADPEALQENTTTYITVNKSDRKSYNLNTEIDVAKSQERKDYAGRRDPAADLSLA